MKVHVIVTRVNQRLLKTTETDSFEKFRLKMSSTSFRAHLPQIPLRRRRTHTAYTTSKLLLTSIQHNLYAFI